MKRFSTHLIIILSLHLALVLGWGWVRIQDTQVQRQGLKVRVSTQIAVAQSSSAPVALQTTPQKKDKTSKIAPVENAATETSSITSETSGISGTEAATIKDVYIAEIRSKIEANKSYPLVSRRMGQTGIVIVAFTLLKDGSIMDLHVHKSSQFERLDASAVDAVRKVGRFNPIPHELRESQLDITVPVKFYL